MQRSANIASLSPSDFSFVGFEELLPELETVLHQVEIRGGDPAARTVDDAIFVPAEEITPIYFEGALLTKDGDCIPEATQLRRGSIVGDIVLGGLTRPVPINPVQDIDEEVVYLGWYLHHFGHFLLETTARMWMLKELDPSTKLVFHIQPPWVPAGGFLDMLMAFGIDPDRVLLPDVQTRFRRVIVPEPLYELAYVAHEQMPALHREVARSIVEDYDPFDQPVYFSRRLLPANLRPVVGELALEEVLRENGCAIVYPETMTFNDQIRLINRHRDVITHAGTAAYLSLFALEAPRLHILTDGIPFMDYFLVPKVIGATTTYCNCLRGGHPAEKPYLPLAFDLEAVTGYLDSQGMIKSRVRASLPPRIAQQRAEYEELLSFAHLKHTLRHETLSSDVEATALQVARWSWPVSWMLARYYAHRDPGSVDHLVHQFTSLVLQETDSSRLAYFYSDIALQPFRLRKHCTKTTYNELCSALLVQFGIDLGGQQETRREERRVERKLARSRSGTHAPTPHGRTPGTEGALQTDSPQSATEPS